MKILVIPDIHLKPWMLDMASKILEVGKAENAVFIGDLVDDFGKQYALDLYEGTINSLIDFIKQYPKTLLCYGNHDVSYLWKYNESGYSKMAEYLVQRGIYKIQESLTNLSQLTYVHRIDNCIFSHAGITEEFLYDNWLQKTDTEKVIKKINKMSQRQLWTDYSPIWWRPFSGGTAWQLENVLQVTGHTPVEEPLQLKSVLMCDTFSTYPNGVPFGNQKFVIVDSVSKEWFVF